MPAQYICARCASVGPTCCQLTPGQEEFCFPLSDIEMDRIRDFVVDKGWFAQSPNSSAFVNHVAMLFPGEQKLVEELFHPRKFHFRLAVDKAGKCIFLSDTGCNLPTEARPYYCRLFPVWVSGGEIMVLGAECLARREARGMGMLLRSFGQTPAKARELHARLRMAWGLPPERGMPRPTVSFARSNR